MIITFLRHAHSDPARDDKERLLSAKGIEQALKFRKLLIGMTYDLIIHSSALRTKETADIIFYERNLSIAYKEVESLYLPETESDISEISKAIMLYPYATPQEVLKRDKNQAWERYSSRAFADIEDIINGKDYKNILIIGHRTIINLLGGKFPPPLENLNTRYFGHLEGFTLT